MSKQKENPTSLTEDQNLYNQCTEALRDIIQSLTDLKIKELDTPDRIDPDSIRWDNTPLSDGKGALRCVINSSSLKEEIISQITEHSEWQGIIIYDAEGAKQHAHFSCVDKELHFVVIPEHLNTFIEKANNWFEEKGPYAKYQSAKIFGGKLAEHIGDLLHTSLPAYTGSSFSTSPYALYKDAFSIKLRPTDIALVVPLVGMHSYESMHKKLTQAFMEGKSHLLQTTEKDNNVGLFFIAEENLQEVGQCLVNLIERKKALQEKLVSLPNSYTAQTKRNFLGSFNLIKEKPDYFSLRGSIAECGVMFTYTPQKGNEKVCDEEQRFFEKEFYRLGGALYGSNTYFNKSQSYLYYIPPQELHGALKMLEQGASLNPV